MWVATEFMGDVDIPLSAISHLDSDQSIDLLTTDKESLALSLKSLTVKWFWMMTITYHRMKWTLPT